MIHKMSDIESKFPQDADLQPKVELDFDFLLNSDSIYKEIKKLNYKQLKSKFFSIYFEFKIMKNNSFKNK